MRRVSRVTVDMEGVLQGVGFRPTVQRLAVLAGIGGWVQNRSGRVRMRLVGPEAVLEAFLAALPARLPAQARLQSLTRSPFESVEADAEALRFSIRESRVDQQTRVSIPADLATCDECRVELFSSGSRYFGYPFTTCTNCGPRYTVVEDMPYDRERTSLSAFPLCRDCRAEYEDPRNRRFHAESIACPRCGPRIWLTDASGGEISGEPLREARRALAAGKIVAVKGLGGFLLAADPFNRESIATLRTRKRRPSKPFALMARSMEVIAHHTVLGDEARAWLGAAEAPIVILDMADRCGVASGQIAPDTRTLGMMLPTTPLHTLLFEPLPGDPTAAFDLLVMTSGNRSGEPISTRNEEALERLSGIADLFLMHDRPIHLRCDDSITVISRSKPQLWRRARGFSPRSIALARPLSRRVLALGAELKNTIAVGYGKEVVLSPHIGDLETPEAVDSLEEVATSLPRFLEQTPELIAVDLHPDMRSTRLGLRLAREGGLPVVRVQHHHAHAAAGLAEHGLDSGLALVFDGTGLGSDGKIWGAELLDLEPGGVRRLASFESVPLPGGDAAVRQPARQLVARWVESGRTVDAAWRERLGIGETEISAWETQCRRGLNAPQTHAAGRLFDAFSAALGISPRRVSYEGQAAIRLEARARECRSDVGLPELPFTLVDREGLLLVDWSESFVRVHEKAPRAADAASWALSFHHAVARAARAMVREAGGTRTGPVLLTGGVFMNRLLVDLLSEGLLEDGVSVVLPRLAPPNDGGISLGQVFVAGGVH